MLYCNIENETLINGPMSLPKNWKNVSNFNTLDDTTLATHNWYPYTAPTILEFQKQDGFNVVGTVATANVVYYDNATILNLIRSKRDGLLLETDWTQLTDAPLTAQQITDYQTYRQTLRDLPQTYSADPKTVVWPTEPS